MSDILRATITNRYAIASRNGQLSITCHTCGLTSYHPEDVANRYCPHCQVFHDDAARAAALAELALPEPIKEAGWRGLLFGAAIAVGFVIIVGVAYLLTVEFGR